MTPTQPTRRVRAGRPPENTGCLPVDYTAQQLADWAAQDAAALAREERALRRSIAAILALCGLVACLVLWGAA